MKCNLVIRSMDLLLIALLVLIICPMAIAWDRLYKKLRYREEHSTSVVLSWCTL